MKPGDKVIVNIFGSDSLGTVVRVCASGDLIVTRDGWKAGDGYPGIGQFEPRYVRPVEQAGEERGEK